MRRTTYARPARGRASAPAGGDLALPPSMYSPVRLPRLTRAPVAPPPAPFLAAGLAALGAGALGAGGLAGAPVMALALLSTAATVRVLARRLGRTDLASAPTGSLAISKTALHLVTDTTARSPLARLVWRRSSLRAGRVERSLSRPSSPWEVVLDHAQGHELRLAVGSSTEAHSMLAALGLDPPSHSASLPVTVSRPAAPVTSPVLAATLGAAASLLSLAEVTRAMMGRAPATPLLVWAVCVAQALLALTYRLRGASASPRPQLLVGVDGLTLPDDHGFVPWAGLTRMRRTRNGLRITRPGHPPVAIDFQTHAAPALPERRAAATTEVEVLRDSVASAIDQYRRLPAPPMPAPDDVEASDSYRQPALALEPLWSTLCDGAVRPDERAAAAEALAPLAPRLLREARRHLVDPAVTATLDRLLARLPVRSAAGPRRRPRGRAVAAVVTSGSPAASRRHQATMHPLPCSRFWTSQAPATFPAARAAALALVSLGAAWVGFGPHRSAAAIAVALMSATAAAQACRPAAPAGQGGHGCRSVSVVDGKLVVLYVTRDPPRFDPTAGQAPWPPATRWPLDRLCSGHLEDSPGAPGATVAVLRLRGDGGEVRLRLPSRKAGRTLLTALGLEGAARATRLDLAPAGGPPGGDWALAFLSFMSALLAGLMLIGTLLEWYAGRPDQARSFAQVVWGFEALSGLWQLPRWRRPARRTLEVGTDGMVVPGYGFVAWGPLRRVTRTERGLRLTWADRPPHEVELQGASEPPLPRRRQAGASATAARRDAVLRSIEQHRRRAALPVPELGPAADGYREAAPSLAGPWAVLCDGGARPEARIAAAEALGAVAPGLLREARRHLVEPATAAALDRILSGTSGHTAPT